MAAATLVAAALLACGDVRPELAAEATLTQRAGEIPSGLADGSSQFGLDTDLRAGLQVRVIGESHRASLTYSPRLLARHLETQGWLGDTALGRPFLVGHGLSAATEHRLDNRWSLRNLASGFVGEQDFVTFLDATGGGGAGSAGVRTPVIEMTSLGLSSQLTGPLVGHNDFVITASFGIAVPGGSEVAEPEAGDSLCFSEPAGGGALGEVGSLAQSCTMGITVATVHPVAARDTLTFTAGYEASDLDPGYLFHTGTLLAGIEHMFSRSLIGSFAAGLTSAADVDGFEVLPRAAIELGGRLVDERMFQVGLVGNLSVLGVADPSLQTFLLRSSASLTLSTTIRRDHTFSVSGVAFLVGPDLGCPPRRSIVEGQAPREGCPNDLSDAERAAEIQDLSSFAVAANYRYAVDERLSFFVGGRYGLRGPHVTRWGSSSQQGNNREVTGSVGLRLTYDTAPPTP